eukprot:1183554-Prorocentrum_minimum.AAC.4
MYPHMCARLRVEHNALINPVACVPPREHIKRTKHTNLPKGRLRSRAHRGAALRVSPAQRGNGHAGGAHHPEGGAARAVRAWPHRRHRGHRLPYEHSHDRSQHQRRRDCALLAGVTLV